MGYLDWAFHLLSFALAAGFSLCAVIGAAAICQGIGIYFRSTSYWIKAKMTNKEKIDLNDYYPSAVADATECCGMAYLQYLEGGPLDCLAAYADFMHNGGNFKPLVMFADATVYGNGARLKTYIKTNALGEVYDSGQGIFNPNSGHRVKAYIWKVNEAAWRQWVADRIILNKKKCS